MTNYEKAYREGERVCGPPFEEFVQFFRDARGELTVLDLGCGQGRDALVAARCGHQVRGVDCSPTGVAQMVAEAQREGMRIEGEVADIKAYETGHEYDVVILDRVLHMLRAEADRVSVLTRACGWVRPGGHVLLADTPRNRELIQGALDGLGWDLVMRSGDLAILRRPQPQTASSSP